jgi:EAL domain-containing protein (putative c-di-GMP-specific phosphodiesterase class I)
MSETNLHSILTGARQAVTYVHPIVNLKDGDTKAQEMLTRFQDDDGEMHTVGGLLDDPGVPQDLRARLDLLCVGTVFDALARDPITDSLVFVNLHPVTLVNPAFWNRIQTWVWKLPIPPHRIVLEITETGTVQDLDQMERCARRVRDLGLRLAVDDLGSGCDTLARLARLTPDFIKVDRSLVHDLHRRPYQAALLNALARFAERMRVGYIAEGIETLDELRAAVDADVPWGQGYLFGKPVPLHQPGA